MSKRGREKLEHKSAMPHHLEVAALGPLGARGGARDLVLDAALAARGKKQTRVPSARCTAAGPAVESAAALADPRCES